MVVPHCGSKTINVRLTVSPDSKSKTGETERISERKNTKKTRLKTRRLFKHDDDEEGSGNACLEPSPEVEKTPPPPPTKQLVDNTMQHQIATFNRQSKDYEKSNGIKNERYQPESSHVMSKDMVDEQITPCCINESRGVQRQLRANEATENTHGPVFSNKNIMLTPKSMCDKVTLNDNHACCQDCQTSKPNCADGMYNSRPCVRRIGRKSRKKTHYHHPATRTRSLSVGNENSYRNNNGDASSGASGKERNDECLNNLRRNDLIDIIRESMEKSRLCFQSNG